MNLLCLEEKLKEKNIKVQAGHCMGGNLDDCTGVTHLFNAMTPLAHRAPGVVTAALNSDVSCEVIVDTFHVDASLYNMLWKLKGRKLSIGIFFKNFHQSPSLLGIVYFHSIPLFIFAFLKDLQMICKL